MGELNLVINNRELRYKGLFRYDKLFHTINLAFNEHGYSVSEKKNEELVTETGRRSSLELRASKGLTAYMELEIRLRITLDNIRDVDIDVEGEDGRMQKYMQGDVIIFLDGWLKSDYEGRWTMQPWVYFVKAFINKYIYTYPLEASFKKTLMVDAADVYRKMKLYLESHRKPSNFTTVDEEEIRRQVASDIARID